MRPFTLERPCDLAAALAFRAQAGRNDVPAEYIAGGTDMVQLLQENVRRPERLVSLAGLLARRVDAGPQGLPLGAAGPRRGRGAAGPRPAPPRQGGGGGGAPRRGPAVPRDRRGAAELG